MPVGHGGGFFAVVGLRRDAAVFRGGGQRKLGLPETGDDPTDCWDARAVLLRTQPLGIVDTLAIAVVDKALRDFRRYGDERRNTRRRAWWESSRAFLFDTDIDLDWPLTFGRVCERFGVDVEAAREAITRDRGCDRRVRLRARRAA